MSNVDPSKFVVLDVETNGLSSIRDDLLSISIFKPDSGELYNRFLPLELNSTVVTTDINGIRTKDLEGLLPLSQEEVDNIIQAFDLKNRTILTYGSIDEKFIDKYFQRHHLQGIDFFAFYNFKHEIISSRFSEGNITKDNLCNMYGIENVQNIHSGRNDCILEWKLFEKMNGHRLLVTNNKVFEFNSEYIVPASFITTYPNLKYYLPHLPRVSCDTRIVFSLPVSAKKLNKYPTNFNGMIFEHVINSMLNVHKIHSEKELLENKKKLNYLGELPSTIDVVPMAFNPDGSMTATRPQDLEIARDINSTIQVMKRLFKPLVDYIGNSIFNGQPIMSQELVIHPENKILALCDLSNENAVLEIKATYGSSIQSFSEQLFYEANGRKSFVLLTDWSCFPKSITYNIHEVTFNVVENVDPKLTRFENAKEKTETDITELVSFINTTHPVTLKCKICGNKWNTSYNLAKKHRPCPICFPQKAYVEHGHIKPKQLPEEEKLSAEEQKIVRKYHAYKSKVETRSEHKLTILSYRDSRSPVKVKCLSCGREWETRADHLLDRPYCSRCRKRKALESFTGSHC